MKNLEIENKYLLSYQKAINFIEVTIPSAIKKIEQIYIKYSKNQTKRIRKIDSNKYVLTIKKGNGQIREEYEKEIDKKKYEKLSKKKIGRKIKKTRYIYNIGKYKYELDIFKGDLKGLAFLEIEFSNIDELSNFKLPEELQKLVVKDVSKDRRYTNAYLAIAQSDNLDFDKIFKEIEDKKENFSIDLKKNVTIYSYIRIYLFLYITLVKIYTSKVLQDNKEEDLHQLRVNIRKIRSILNLHKEIFDKKIYKKLNLGFKTAAKISNKKRDIDVFLLLLSKYKKESFKELIEHLKNIRVQENKKIISFLNSKTYNDLLDNFTSVLKDDSNFFINYAAYIPVKVYVRKKSKKMRALLRKDISTLKEKSDIRDFHKVRVEIKKFRYFCDTFHIKLKLKKYQDLFGELNDTLNQINILEEFISNNPENNDLKNLLKTLQKQSNRLKDKILTYAKQLSNISF